MIAPEQIDLWRSSARETQNLEFKQAKNQYDTGKYINMLRVVNGSIIQSNTIEYKKNIELRDRKSVV